MEKLLTCWAFSLSAKCSIFSSHRHHHRHWYSQKTHIPVLVDDERTERQNRTAWVQQQKKERGKIFCFGKAAFSTKTPGMFSLINVVHIIIMCICSLFMYICIYTLRILYFMIAHSHDDVHIVVYTISRRAIVEAITHISNPCIYTHKISIYIFWDV